MNSLRLTMALVSFSMIFACGDDDGVTDSGTADVGRSDTGTGDAGGDDAGDDAGGDDAGGDDGGADDAGGDAGGDAGDRMCGDVVEVATVEELVALAPADWGRVGFESQWPASADIRSTASFTVMGSDFAVPGDCMSPGCSPNVNVSVRNTVSGVTGSGGSVDITSDAVFRMRFNIQFLAPVSDFPMVVVEKACSLECAGEETRCADDDSCYTTGRQYCRACDRESAMRCACVGDDGADLANGTECSYITGDLGFVGTCMDGSCSAL